MGLNDKMYYLSLTHHISGTFSELFNASKTLKINYHLSFPYEEMHAKRN